MPATDVAGSGHPGTSVYSTTCAVSEGQSVNTRRARSRALNRWAVIRSFSHARRSVRAEAGLAKVSTPADRTTHVHISAVVTIPWSTDDEIVFILNHPVLPQPFDLVVGVAQLAQHLIGVLTEKWRRQRDATWGLTQFDR